MDTLHDLSRCLAMTTGTRVYNKANLEEAFSTVTLGLDQAIFLELFVLWTDIRPRSLTRLSAAMCNNCFKLSSIRNLCHSLLSTLLVSFFVLVHYRLNNEISTLSNSFAYCATFFKIVYSPGHWSDQPET